MAEVLIASSVLIAALLLLRGVFRKSLSRRIQYALWGLVLLRLLIPFQLPQAGFSVLTSLQPVRAAVETRLETHQSAPAQPSASLPGGTQQQAHGQQPAASAPVHSSPAETAQVPAPADSALPAPRPALTAAQVLSLVRWAGTALLALFFLWVNLGFWLRLRRTRTPCPVEGCARRTYLVEEGLSSPCLFGLLRPAVYLTPAAVSSPQRLRHIMAHEETHARHLDPLWSLLRCVCLALYWFDPLVWIASAAARTDCELACDEGTLARLGDEARIPYGETLLSLVPVRRAPSPLLTATTMTTGKRRLKDRLSRIIHRPRRLAAATAAALALAAAVSACTFTAASRTDPQVPSLAADPAPDVPTPSASSASAPAALLGTGAAGEVLPLDLAEPYEAEPFALDPIRSWDGQTTCLSPETADSFPYTVCLLSSSAEQRLAIVDMSVRSVQYGCFLTLPAGCPVQVSVLDGGLLGWEGPVFRADYQTEDWTDHSDFFRLASDGSCVHLAHAQGRPEEVLPVDLDGDGTVELATPTQLFFLRGGAVYVLPQRAQWNACIPDLPCGWSGWHADTGLLEVSGLLTDGSAPSKNWSRWLRFDGSGLTICPDPRVYEDHMRSGLDAPADVLAKARELIASQCRPFDSFDSGGVQVTVEYDDWRIESVADCGSIQIDGLLYYTYEVEYKYHAATPAVVTLAGGMYMTEDDWVHLDRQYLLFRSEADGSLTFVGQQQAMDLTVEEAAQLILLQTGLLPDDPSYWIQDLWDELTAQDVPLTLTLARDAGGGTYLAPEDLQGRSSYSTIPLNYRWRSVDGASIPSLAEEDALTVGYASRSLTFYDPSGLVRCERGGACRWFQAVPKSRGNGSDFPPFRAVRTWYDAVEIHILRAAAVVPDDGRSREAIAQELMERYEGACLSATTGSIDRCTYIAIRDMEVNESAQDISFPEEIREKEPFRVSFQVVFVPESEQSLQWTLACDPHVYEGADAPDGARGIYCTAALYLAPDGWRCHSVGG